MAVAQEAGSVLFSPQVMSLLQSLIGGEQDTNQTESKTGSTTGSSTTNQTGSQQTTGSQNTTNNQTQNQQQQTTGTQATTGTSTQNTTQTTQNLADITQLMQVFQQQQQGITPDVLAAIFSEGAKAAPGLVAATANAAGARSSGNAPLATALTELNSNLVRQAATQSQDMRNASAQTAGLIAELTKQQQTTGTTTGQQTQNTTTDQLVNMLSTLLGTQNTTNNQNTTSNQSQTQNQTQNTTENSNLNQSVDTSLDTGNLSKLLGGLLGYGVLNNGLSGVGGVSGAVGGVTNWLGGGIQNLLGQLGITDQPLSDEEQALWDSIIGDSGIYDPPAAEDFYMPIPEIDFSGGGNWWDDLGFGDDYNWSWD